MKDLLKIFSFAVGASYFTNKIENAIRDQTEELADRIQRMVEKKEKKDFYISGPPSWGALSLTYPPQKYTPLTAPGTNVKSIRIPKIEQASLYYSIMYAKTVLLGPYLNKTKLLENEVAAEVYASRYPLQTALGYCNAFFKNTRICDKLNVPYPPINRSTMREILSKITLKQLEQYLDQLYQRQDLTTKDLLRQIRPEKILENVKHD